MALPIPTTYLYQKRNEAVDDLRANTGLNPLSIVDNTVGQLSVPFGDILPPGDKQTLDDFMDTRGYNFVSQAP